MRDKTLDFLRFPYTMFTGGMMSDENTEEKKPGEHQDDRPWIPIKFDELVNSSGKKTDELLKELFEDENQKRFNQFEEPYTQKIVDSFRNKVELSLEKGFLLKFWEAWAKTWEREDRSKLSKADDLTTRDYTVITLLLSLDDKYIQELYTPLKQTDYHFNALLTWCQNTFPNNPSALEYIGRLIEKVGVRDWRLCTKGKNLIAKSYVLRAKDELKNEILDSVNVKVKEVETRIQEEANKQIEEIKKGLDSKVQDITTELSEIVPSTKKEIEEKIKDNETRMTRNFVQIIGIFAAIIAFIVTMVPTAARLGGASIPVALAGLAIVTAGIIVLLAMIFGKDERGKSLSKGLTGIIIAFILWLTLTVVLAFVEPNVLAPPERVDTLYIDTVETTPPPTPSIEEGE